MIILHGDNRFYNNLFVQNQPVPETVPDGWGSAERIVNCEVGTHKWNGYPLYEDWIKQFDLDQHRPNMGKLQDAHFDHLPVWIDGNAYLGGAQVFDKEENYLLDASEAKVELVCEDGKYLLKTDVFDRVKGMRSHLITTDTLGKAFEPEAKYENPDGTPITLDEDYFGGKRSLHIMPGPFATPDLVNVPVWEDR